MCENRLQEIEQRRVQFDRFVMKLERVWKEEEDSEGWSIESQPRCLESTKEEGDVSELHEARTSVFALKQQKLISNYSIKDEREAILSHFHVMDGM